MADLSASLAELPLDETTRTTVFREAASLKLLLGNKSALHDRLKQLGVAKIGLRQKVALCLEQAPTESAAAARLRASLLARSGLEPHADALCARADELIVLGTSSSKELHELLRACGVKALGLRQQVVMALQPLLPTSAAVAAAPPPRVPKSKPAAPPPAPPPPPADEDDELALEGNEEELTLEGNEDEDEEDEGLQLEDNAGGNAGDDDDDDELALEENTNEGGGDDDDDDDDDDAGLALEENDPVAGAAAAGAAAAGADDSDEDGFLMIEANDGASSTTTASSADGHGALASSVSSPHVLVNHPHRTPRGSSLDTTEPALELVEPPWLPQTSAASGEFAKEAEDPVEAAMMAGITGSQALQRRNLIQELLRLKTHYAPGEHIDKLRYQHVLDYCARLHLGFQTRALADTPYRATLAHAGTELGKPRTPKALPLGGYTGAALGASILSSLSLDNFLDASETKEQRVCVLGMGTGVPALSAAKAGAQVVWAERIERFAELAKHLIERNRVAKNVHVLSGASAFEALAWGSTPPATSPDVVPSASFASGGFGAGGFGASTGFGAAAAAGSATAGIEGGGGGGFDKFDAVITEEFSDDLLSDGLLELSSFARSHLLKKGGVFYPRRAKAYAALASVRTTDTCGFDTRLFNVFRNYDKGDIVYDFEEVCLNEPGCATMLSEPIELFDLDLNGPPPSWADPAAPVSTERLVARASRAGVFNCLVTWFDLDMGDEAGTLSFAPDAASPRHMYFRAIKQRLFFNGFEQRLAPNQLVGLELLRSAQTFRVACAADAHAQQSGDLVLWPSANVLSYHFPMIAEAPRNVRFERALLRAIRHYTSRHGRGPHVLDIGSGTGLLAMMAARGGARKVTSVEMVPAVCAVASQIIERNGYGEVVEVVNVRSDELSLYTMGGEPADILVSELIDDHVIGDGVLSSIADARRRLLTPDALIVPRASRMYLQPVSLRCKGPNGLLLDDLNAMRSDQLVLSFPYHSGKLQRMHPGDYEVLGPPVEVFDFDWSIESGLGLADGRTSPVLPLRFARGGVCNALMILFTLQMDAQPGMERAGTGAEAYDPSLDDDYSSGLDNKETHWDNPMRFLPVELQVQQGTELQVVCTHNAHNLEKIGLHGVTDAMLAPPGGQGHVNLIDSEMGMQLGVTLSRQKLVPRGK